MENCNCILGSERECLTDTGCDVIPGWSLIVLWLWKERLMFYVISLCCVEIVADYCASFSPVEVSTNLCEVCRKSW